MVREYNDSYQAQSTEMGGARFEFAELEHHILKNRREELGLTQQQVADLAKIQLRQYQRLESGERSIYSASFRIAVSVCRALQLDPQRFMDAV